MSVGNRSYVTGGRPGHLRNRGRQRRCRKAGQDVTLVAEEIAVVVHKLSDPLTRPCRRILAADSEQSSTSAISAFVSPSRSCNAAEFAASPGDP
jgi:hypothetical protein